MPSGLHEVVIELLRAAPARIVEIVRDVGVDVTGVEVRGALVVDPTVPQLVSPALASDLVIEVPAAGDGKSAAFVVEVQRAIDRSKELTWPVTWATARQRVHGGSTCLVVITDQEAVAGWAHDVLAGVVPAIGTGVVIGPPTMPRITDAATAARSPEAAALSALIHAGRDDADLVAAIAAACSTLRGDRGMLLYDVLVSRLTRRAITELEALMQKQGYEWQSEFARRHRAEGRDEGRAEVRAEAAARLRDALDVVLQLRSIRLSDDQRAIADACLDLERLQEWVHRAATATTAVEVFHTGAEDPRSTS